MILRCKIFWLRKREHLPENLAPLSENASVELEQAVLDANHDVSIVEPKTLDFLRLIS